MSSQQLFQWIGTYFKRSKFHLNHDMNHEMKSAAFKIWSNPLIQMLT